MKKIIYIIEGGLFILQMLVTYAIIHIKKSQINNNFIIKIIPLVI